MPATTWMATDWMTGALSISTDAGVTWSTPFTPAWPGGGNKMNFPVTDGHIWLSGSWGCARNVGYSLDGGHTWAPLPSMHPFDGPNGGCTKLAWNGAIWIAVGYDAVNAVNIVAHASDPLGSWTVDGNPFPIIQHSLGTDVAWNGAMWALIGGWRDLSGTHAAVAICSDNIHWMATATTLFPSSNWQTIAWSGHNWVAGGYNSLGTGNIAWSPDASAWTPITPQFFQSVCNEFSCTGSRIVAIGDDINTLAYSDDHGRTWAPLGDSIFVSEGYSVAWDGTLFLAGSADANPAFHGAGRINNLARSTDGINWTGMGLGPFGSNGISALTCWPSPGLNHTPPGMNMGGRTGPKQVCCANYSRKATLDARDALALGLKKIVEEIRFPGFDTDRFAEIYDEWPSFNESMVVPAAAVLPGEFRYADWGDTAGPHLIEDTWEPKGLPGCGLYRTAEVVLELQLAIRTNLPAERAVLMRAVEDAFQAPRILMQQDGARYGLVRAIPEYYGLDGRFALLSGSVIDNEDTAMREKRDAVFTISARIPKVQVGPVWPMALKIEKSTQVGAQTTTEEIIG